MVKLGFQPWNLNIWTQHKRRRHFPQLFFRYRQPCCKVFSSFLFGCHQLEDNITEGINMCSLIHVNHDSTDWSMYMFGTIEQSSVSLINFTSFRSYIMWEYEKSVGTLIYPKRDSLDSMLEVFEIICRAFSDIDIRILPLSGGRKM